MDCRLKSPACKKTYLGLNISYALSSQWSHRLEIFLNCRQSRCWKSRLPGRASV